MVQPNPCLLTSQQYIHTLSTQLVLHTVLYVSIMYCTIYCYCCASTAVISPLSRYSKLQENSPDNTIPYVACEQIPLSLSLFPSLTHSLTHSLPHSLPHSLTHSLTSSLTYFLPSSLSHICLLCDYSKLYETAIVLVLYKQLGMTVNSIMLARCKMAV